MNSDGKPQGLHLRPHKGTYLVSFYFLDSGNQNLARRVLPEESCPTRLARRDLPDNARQQPSTGSKPPGELCARRPGNIPDGNS
ncbi:hypothetical protein ACFX10_042638 [Malus domestica]